MGVAGGMTRRGDIAFKVWHSKRTCAFIVKRMKLDKEREPRRVGFPQEELLP